MISCTEFIPAYSELFRALQRLGGRKAVEEFWNCLSDRFLTNLRELVSEHGLRGCWLYWSRTLNEEAADFTMELDEEQGLFRIRMHHCPSKGRLLEADHFLPYPDYCRHCDVLYRRVLEPLGFTYDIDLSNCDRAACTLTVRGPAKPHPAEGGGNPPGDAT
ncbi:MAG: hypothetical protein JXR77_06170 [Lentisphaeria bacterium]|nr:hypothetical protein [Lentisphaeria bacterium]